MCCEDQEEVIASNCISDDNILILLRLLAQKANPYEFILKFVKNQNSSNTQSAFGKAFNYGCVQYLKYP